jgi:8-oxo-dGTP pyrophosphatase MutT (NUDIX family)
MRKPPYRTVRCVIRQGQKFLLVMHRAPPGSHRRAWGLPGGRVAAGEGPEETARREVREELRIALGALRAVGDYRYKGRGHRVLGTDYDGLIISFDRAELLKIRWHTLDEVAALRQQGRLHAGFEEAAIRDFLRLAADPT